MLGYLLAASLPETLDQMCSGRIGTHTVSMLALGLEHSNLTVVSSTATALLMPSVAVVKFERSFSLM